MKILGINSAYHESSACLLVDGRVVAAVEEERFNRFRHGKHADLLNPHYIPEQSIKYCLQAGGIAAEDIDYIGYSLVPDVRFEKNVGVDKEFINGSAGSYEGEETFYYLNKVVPDKLSRLFGYDVSPKFQWIQHHLCHAASTFFVSPFKEAAILSVDGIGEFASFWFGYGKDNKIEKLRAIFYPNSLGFLWTKFSRFLGFGEYGQWKVMGLAAYGNPDVYYNEFLKFVSFDEDGNFTVNGDVLQYRTDKFNKFEKLFGNNRASHEEIEERHKDIAASLQKITNEVLLNLTNHLHNTTQMDYLTIAGGVGLNCVANNYILEQGAFKDVFIQPAANDAGTAIGACLYIWHQVLDNEQRYTLENVYLGPDYSCEHIKSVLDDKNIKYTEHENIVNITASLLAEGNVVAWFQGRMEFGPRALGNRSFLADPRRIEMAHYINEKIKHREFFRPFAASVLEEKCNEWFDIKKNSSCDKYMLFSRTVKSDKLGLIPSVTHIDNTCRIQTVNETDNARFHSLLEAFNEITDTPVILNTSFNDREPVICTPQDAINTCVSSDIRWIVFDNLLVDLSNQTIDIENQEFSKKQLLNNKLNQDVLETPVQMIFRSR